jgi:TRAP-type C4-dicarboxylate transport system substrate-binding protein
VKKLSLFVALMLAAPMAIAQPVVVKAGSVAPEGTPWEEWLNTVKKRMEATGKVKMKLFLAGKLGGEREMVEATKAGRVQLFGGSVGALASKYAPELNVFELPFLFESNAEADYVMNAVRGDVEELLRKRGFEMVMWAENGWHGYGGKGKCLNHPDQMKGMKMRSQESVIHLDTYKAFGAAPVEIPVPEVLSSLQTGVVDGYSNTPLFSFAISWYQGIDHFAYTRHIYQPALIVVSKKWFDKQNDEVKAIMKSKAEEKMGFDGVRKLTGPLLDNFKALGITMCDVPQENRKAFASKIGPVWAKFAKKSKGNAKMLEAVKKAKAEFAKK